MGYKFRVGDQVVTRGGEIGMVVAHCNSVFTDMKGKESNCIIIELGTGYKTHYSEDDLFSMEGCGKDEEL